METNFIINGDQSARIENVLLGLVLLHLFRSPRSRWTIKNISDIEWAVIAALVSGFLAVLISQLLRHKFVFKP